MEELDELIGCQIPIVKNDQLTYMKVISRERDDAGNLIGECNPTSSLVTHIYNMEFPDGHYEHYTSNILAEALYSSVDDGGFDSAYLCEICDYQCDATAVTSKHGFVTCKNGNQVPVITTNGWHFKLLWRDGSTTWTTLRVLKHYEPLMLAEYAKRVGITDQPAFRWWVSLTLRQRHRLVLKIKT